VAAAPPSADINLKLRQICDNRATTSRHLFFMMGPVDPVMEKR
jgi:hypothetical protein